MGEGDWRLETDWPGYYKALEGRQPRPLFCDALARFPTQPPDGPPRLAVDLGCGDGTESLALLAQGWRVLAIDSEPAAAARLRAAVPSGSQDRLEIRLDSFDRLELPPADLVWAGYSLPFCPPAAFDRLWGKIVTAIRPGGRFAGQLFGTNDSWAADPTMNFHSPPAVYRRLAESFTIEKLREIDEDGYDARGPKHWHIFDIIARRD